MEKLKLVSTLSKDRNELLLEIKELNKMQPEYIKSERFLKLEKNIETGNEIFTRIKVIENEIRNLKKEIEAEIKACEYAEEICKIDDESEKLIKEILSINELNASCIKEKMDEIKTNIRDIKKNKKGLIAYNGYESNVSGAYFDISR